MKILSNSKDRHRMILNYFCLTLVPITAREKQEFGKIRAIIRNLVLTYLKLCKPEVTG